MSCNTPVIVDQCPGGVLVAEGGCDAVVTEQERAVVVVAPGEQGPPGRPGIPGPAGGQVLQRTAGRPVPSGAIIAPAGARGPAFLITQNFRAILKYNASDSYALGVAYLADAIAGRQGIQQSWPRGDRALSTGEKAEIQRQLSARFIARPFAACMRGSGRCGGGNWRQRGVAIHALVR